MTLGAGIRPIDVQPHDAAANRRPERNVYLILEIGAWFRTGFGRAAAPAEDPGKNILKAAAAAGFASSARPRTCRKNRIR